MGGTRSMFWKTISRTIYKCLVVRDYMVEQGIDGSIIMKREIGCKDLNWIEFGYDRKETI